MSQVIQSLGQYILFDEAYMSGEDCTQLFATGLVADSMTRQKRGCGSFFQYGKHFLVAKYYLRGGVLARFVRDRYFGCHAEATRAFKEWRLLATMRSKGLPVPDPVAARVVIKACFYQASLVTVQIDNAKTLAEYLSDSSLERDGWQAIGVCIKRFHTHGVYHADLNASNILINQRQELFILDFDKGAIKTGEAWKVNNLERLQRSLHKLKRKNPAFDFNQDDWNHLIQAYIHS